MSYYDTIVAYGIAADQAEIDAWANDMQRFRNRESALYGVLDEADMERRVEAARSVA
jgi:hypothetical protein